MLEYCKSILQRASMRNLITTAVFVLTLITFSACSSARFNSIADIRNYSQNPLDYVNQEESNISGERLTKGVLQTDFDTHYFAAWKLKQPPFEVQKAKWPWLSYTAENSFQENHQPLEESWFKLMALESNFEKFGKLSKPGIVIQVSSIRNFPSKKPLFKNFELAGEGYPFDYNQNSITTSNEPILISHYSKTKEWAYIVTSYTSGWVPSHNIALVSPDIINRWAKSRQATLLEDDLPLYDLNKEFITNSRIGMMLPIMKVENDMYQAILATSKTGGYVTFTIVRIPKNASIAESLPINSQSIAIMAKSFIGKPYGWGGLYDNRDCSSTMRDIFKPFGVWLPRNSEAQAKVGRVMSVDHLKVKEKERAIIENAIPFQTLLYKPGHIMLYLGHQNGKVMIMHNMWGVTTKAAGLEKRSIVGRTIISTLRPGKELNGYVKSASIIEGITSINNFTMKPTEQPIILEAKKAVKKERTRRSRRGSRKPVEEDVVVEEGVTPAPTEGTTQEPQTNTPPVVAAPATN